MSGVALPDVNRTTVQRKMSLGNGAKTNLLDEKTEGKRGEKSGEHDQTSN